METQRTHPLIITAAVAVILASGVGIASMTGMLPSSSAVPAPQTPAAEMAQASALPAPSTPESTAAKPSTDHPASSSQSAPAQHTPAAPKPVHKAPVSAKPQPSSSSQEQVAAVTPKAAPVCNDCGEITAVRERKIQGEGSGAGAVAGGVTGAVIGKQFGNGNGQKAMAVLGAIGGAMAGNKIEKEIKAKTVYEVEVSLNNGDRRTFTFDQAPTWQRGDRVQIINGEIRNRG